MYKKLTKVWEERVNDSTYNGHIELYYGWPVTNCPKNIIIMLIILLQTNLLPTGSEEREVLGVGSITVAILPSCQNMKIIVLQLIT